MPVTYSVGGHPSVQRTVIRLPALDIHIEVFLGEISVFVPVHRSAFRSHLLYDLRIGKGRQPHLRGSFRNRSC